jgi:hypothetical protein
MSELTAALTWLPVFLVLGAVLHVIDHHLGSLLYRWWYNMTHRDPLPADVKRGFVYQQSAQARFQAAVLLAALQSLLAAFGGANPIIELLTIIVETPVAMVGFYCGPFLDKIWTRKDTVFSTVDKLESGELSMTDEVRKISAEAVETIREAITGDDEEPLPSKESSSAETLVEAEKNTSESIPEEEEIDPRDLMKKYTNRDG